MGHLVGLQFNTNVLGPGLVLGVAAAGLYGLLAIALVLTFRASRTVGFVQGGLALFSCYFYWWLTFDTGKDIFNPVHPPALPLNGSAHASITWPSSMKSMPPSTLAAQN